MAENKTTHTKHSAPKARGSSIRHCQLLLLLLFVLLSACGKDKDSEPGPEDVPPPVKESMFNKVIRVNNVGAEFPKGHEPMSDKEAIYYSLENNTTVDVRYKQTFRWDLSISGIYRSFLGGNNAGDKKNFGYKGPGKGGILILEKAFDDVVDIPSDDQFRTGSGIIGTDDSGAFGEGIGYYCYDWGGDAFFDGSWAYGHCAYALADTAIMYAGTKKERKLLPRTMVIKTARGNYAKLCVLSLYKDAIDPKDWKRTTPHTFHTFEYVLAKAGSTKFEIKD